MSTSPPYPYPVDEPHRRPHISVTDPNLPGTSIIDASRLNLQTNTGQIAGLLYFPDTEALWTFLNQKHVDEIVQGYCNVRHANYGFPSDVKVQESIKFGSLVKNISSIALKPLVEGQAVPFAAISTLPIPGDPTQMMAAWNTDGNYNFEGAFSWLWDLEILMEDLNPQWNTLGKLFSVEFDMYQHHL